ISPLLTPPVLSISTMQKISSLIFVVRVLRVKILSLFKVKPNPKSSKVSKSKSKFFYSSTLTNSCITQS
ncbi:hypothetical protein, partial [Klebsiella pneumoniae]|uniref:hypothetical protein n=1 Tax=Klebsiella pneumoniae TaxID=573 RepID=UPI001968D539